MEKQRQYTIWYFVIAFVLRLIFQNYVSAPHTENLAYNEFKALLEAGKLEDVALAERTITGALKPDGLDAFLSRERLEELKRYGDGVHRFVTVRVDDPNLVADLEAAKIRFSGTIESRWLATLLSWILPALVFIGVWMLIAKRMAGGGMGGMLEIGKSKAKVYMEKQTGVTFEDVAGVDEAKEELKEVVEFLKQPERYGRLGSSRPRSACLRSLSRAGAPLRENASARRSTVLFAYCRHCAFMS